MAYRTSVSHSTKKAPFFLAYGKEPSLLIETAFPTGEQTQEVDEQVASAARGEPALGLFKHQQDAQTTNQDAQDNHKKYYNQAHQPPSYNINNLVLLNNARRAQHKGDKLAPRWTKPHKIVEICDKGVVRLKGKSALPNMTRIKPYNQPSSIPSADEPLTSSQPTIATHKPLLT